MLGNLCTKDSNKIHLGMMLASHPSLENKMVLRNNSALSLSMCMHLTCVSILCL